MMIKETRKAYGYLHANGEKWFLLDPEPQKRNLPFWARESGLEFQVVGNNGDLSLVWVIGHFVLELFGELKDVNVNILPE